MSLFCKLMLIRFPAALDAMAGLLLHVRMVDD